jgi:hypothetical protein
LIGDNKVLNSNLSNNDIASGNLSQNTLISFGNVLNGLDKLVALFFPSVRNAMVERYRAETTLIIGNMAENLKNKYGIEVEPIPPKAAIPLFDKLSLEHEDIMFDLWAKLLVDTSATYTPIHIQYAEILSRIGGQEAKLLQAVFNFQKGKKHLINDITDELKEYNNKCLIADAADEISGNLEIGDIVEDEGIYSLHRSSSTPEVHINVSYPDNVIIYNRAYLFDYKICEETSLDLLKQLNLIGTFYDSGDLCVVLTELGYDLLEMLEKYEQ